MPIRKIIHIDMDAFYASVEQRDNPSLRGKPIAIGRPAEERGVIATASYEARVFGVKSALSTAEAFRLCSGLILVQPDFTKYEAISIELYKIYQNWTDIIETVALDECYLDVSHHRSATIIAHEIKKRIKDQLQLTASAGVSVNKLLAKIASDINKPDGICVVEPGIVSEFIKKVPVKDINGVGSETMKKIYSLHLGSTCNDLQVLPLIKMIEYFGSFGEKLYYYVRGIDDRPVFSDRESKSIGTETTFQVDMYDLKKLHEIINEQLREVVSRGIEKSLKWRTVTLKIKYKNFKQITRSKSFDYFDDDFSLFSDEICLLLKEIDITQGVRLSGVTISNFVHKEDEHYLF
ncbi:MAG: hypothetical protein A2015_13095 [Spirochaetes bacterium GWF1_31_7]|nr:MAG: hypothetical protein A2Y30_00500 [Spirochaetes bacterium GWE1_32_154]OHD51321.1 MAG: hypothetical protein A2Y29_00945 [Spirochaetes bacterium GWE2_31_10]OHD51518.1 MAG: hypothetical protein A2015_13095 [Spirochaetes bacterium GWF1_31_7]OHD82785.1 MAG: hypothetical protein A2355_07265 [Spirochaetes bacterium RIFOXYB1_FULL_32_8]HBD95867.1 DNA polymerase IV [Spirochaetia bacterium]